MKTLTLNEKTTMKIHTRWLVIILCTSAATSPNQINSTGKAKQTSTQRSSRLKMHIKKIIAAGIGLVGVGLAAYLLKYKIFHSKDPHSGTFETNTAMPAEEPMHEQGVRIDETDDEFLSNKAGEQTITAHYSDNKLENNPNISDNTHAHLTKPWSQLQPEEQKAVLRHLATAEKYKEWFSEIPEAYQGSLLLACAREIIAIKNQGGFNEEPLPSDIKDQSAQEILKKLADTIHKPEFAGTWAQDHPEYKEKSMLSRIKMYGIADTIFKNIPDLSIYYSRGYDFLESKKLFTGSRNSVWEEQAFKRATEDQSSTADKKRLAEFYKIHLMPKPEEMMTTYIKILEAIKANPKLGSLISSMKLVDAAGPSTKQVTLASGETITETMPRIVIYPAEGRAATQELLNELYKALNGIEGDGHMPRYNAQIDSLLFVAQGNGDFKANNPKLFTADKVYYQWQTEPLTNPAHQNSCRIGAV